VLLNLFVVLDNMRHVLFLILQNILNDYEKGKYSDIQFLNLITTALANKK